MDEANPKADQPAAGADAHEKLKMLIGRQSSGRLAFIISKPLQFMISAQIIDEYDLSAQADLLISEDFFGAADFVDKYQRKFGTRWGKATLFPDNLSAYRYARREKNYGAIFIDSDVGLRRALQLLRYKLTHPKSSIIVYEEGIGTYRTDLYNGKKRAIFPWVGVATCFGRSPLTAAIMVLEPRRYLDAVGRGRAVVLPAGKGVVDFVRTNINILAGLFKNVSLDSRAHDQCWVYLSSWQVFPDVIKILEKSPRDVFFKPHPHIRYDVEIQPANNIRIIHNGTPAELVIICLMHEYRCVTVLHHGSSTAHYLAAARVRFVNIDDDKTVFPDF